MRRVEKSVIFEHLGQGIILDIGSGAGAQSIMLARAGRQVVSLDISRSMSRRLMRNARNAGVFHLINPVVADAQNLPFKDGVFGSVISIAGAIAHCIKYFRAISEIVRITKRTGTIILTVLNRWSLPSLIKPLLMLNFWRLKFALGDGDHYRM